jgi:tRNA A37 threonylcarbamoyladenosine synthetase subunit TsaC/SUA5/YrdC
VTRGLTLSPEAMAVVGRVDETDWTQTTLDLDDPDDRSFAAHAVALGAAMFYGFANFCALAGRPEHDAVLRINRIKGRADDQVGSVTTTRPHFEGLFEWTRLPSGVDRERVLALVDDFYALGPMGFRGPAVDDVPDHLVSEDEGVRTVQLIAPGYACPSNELVDETLARTHLEYLFITSANRSSRTTGKTEPAHYELRTIRRDFGGESGVVLIGHRDEEAVRASYPRHRPMSTSIVGFHRLADDGRGGPALVLERHGSLAFEDASAIAAKHGLGLVSGEGADERLPERQRTAVGGLPLEPPPT